MAEPDLLYMLRSRHYENSRQLRDMAANEIKRLREQLHYANGTCELALKHRDEAEAEVERLRAALQWIVDNTDPMKAPLIVGRAKFALHAANGTCELALKHRDEAEAEVADLRDLLRQCLQHLGDWRLTEDIRHALKLGCQQETS